MFNLSHRREDTFICDFFYSELFTHTDLIQSMCRSAGFQPKAVLLTDDFSATRTVRLLRRKGSHLSEAAMDFREYAREHYA